MSYSHQIAAENFGDFTFHIDLEQTMFGGDKVVIWYHPGCNFKSGGLDSAWDREWIPVMDVYYQTRGEYKVAKFNKELGWQRALVHVLKNQNTIAARIDKAQKILSEKRKKTLTRQKQDDEETKLLLEKARELRITSR